MFKKTLAFFATLLSCAILVGCSGLQALNVITPHSGYELHKDIAYGSLDRQKLDVYVPDQPDAHHSVVLFFYGGSWQMGNKDLYRFVGQTLASQGYVTVVADYRLYPDVYYPAFMNDAAAALKWTHQNIAGFGGNADRVFVAGHSAGAHIAMMLTLNDAFIKEQGGKTSWIKGTIGIAGPYDFLPFTDPKIKAIFSKLPEQESQPINYVRPHLPPILLLHGNADDNVYLRNSAHLANKLRANHDSVVFKTYDGVGHIDIVLGLTSTFRSRAPTLKDMNEFIKTH